MFVLQLFRCKENKSFKKYIHTGIYKYIYILVIHFPFLFVYSRLTKQCDIQLEKCIFFRHIYVFAQG